MATKALKIQTVPVGALHPNPWNPNRQDARTYEAERESIRQYGFIDPVTVREHPTEEGAFEIVDGEHRWRAAGEEGHSSIAIVSLGKLADADAKKLTIILNETRGEADIALLGTLLHDLDDQMERIDLLIGLPFTPNDLDHLLSIGGTDWGDYQDGKDGIAAEKAKGEQAELHEVVLLFSQAQRERFGVCLQIMAKELDIDGPSEIVLAALELAAKSA